MIERERGERERERERETERDRERQRETDRERECYIQPIGMRKILFSHITYSIPNPITELFMAPHTELLKILLHRLLIIYDIIAFSMKRLSFCIVHKW